MTPTAPNARPLTDAMKEVLVRLRDDTFCTCGRLAPARRALVKRGLVQNDFLGRCSSSLTAAGRLAAKGL